ncbi:MAG: trehalose-phosphatase [Gaiellaceae bacterium]
MKPNLLLSDLAAAPGRAALLLDVDGTLAPIVPRPEDARVPDKTRSLLRELAARYALVACVSGRSSSEARRIVGVEELLYVGTHGLELAPGAAVWRDQIERFAAGVDWPPEWVEDKGLSLSLHYRQAPEPEQSRLALKRIAEAAEEVGLRARFGRMLLEILPPVEADKGTAVRSLLDERGLKRALYAGDDTTDLDAFRALEGLELGVCVALGSSEAPAALAEAADIVLAGPAELVELLQAL